MSQISNTESTPITTSIILVGYNSRADLEGCLESLRSDWRDGLEILLVDNASEDGTAAWVQAEYPEVKVIRSHVNLGFGGANNMAAAQARGKFLAFLNPDTRVESGWLEALVAALEDDTQAGMVTSKILLLEDPGRINTCGNDVHLTGLTLCRGMGAPASAFNQREYVSAVSGAAFAIRRDLFHALGGFDRCFFLYMEDTDLSWRVQLAGYRCLFVPESIVLHDYRLTFGPQKTFYQERNRYLMMLKNLRWKSLLALLPALVLAEVVTWGFALTRDRRNWTNKLRAYFWVIRNWNAIRQARSEVQRMRRMPDGAILHATTHRLVFEQTGNGLSARLAHRLFDPAFQAYYSIIQHFIKNGTLPSRGYKPG